MSAENSTTSDEQARNARLARVISAGDVLIGIGWSACVLSVALGVMTGFTGGSLLAFVGVIPGLLLVATGYLKRIAAALVEQL